MPGKFVHLHVHSEYSLLDGANRTKDLVARAAKLKQPAIALTDHGVMYGALEFYCKAKEKGIKPIVGCELYVCKDRTDRSSHGKRSPNRTFHLIALAKNRTGYQNLVKIVSIGHLEGYYYKPRVDYEVLERYHEGIIFLSGCLGSEIPQHILGGNLEAAYERARWFKQLKGEDFYLELQDHGLPEQAPVNEALIAMHRELDLKLVASNDAHYTCFEDSNTHAALVSIQSGKTLNDPASQRYKPGVFYVNSEEEMLAKFAHVPEALTNTLEIASKCNLIIELGRPQLPQYPLPSGHTEASYLSELAWKGARRRYAEMTPEVEQRLKYELDMIERMGFPGYFLIVWDFINWSKENGIEVGPGRGSAAGSIAAYCLGITDIDPLPYNLLFERFLNPERVSMPDIDVDFCIDRRGEVIKYVQDKYGHDKVAQIVTFGTLGAKAAIKDTGRVLEFPFADTNRLCKLVPPELGITLADATKEGSELDAEAKKNPQVDQLLTLARKLEGYVRSTGIHAAGVVISRDPLDTIVPLQRASKDENGFISTQYEQKYLEMMGLLKMDFLGLRNLTMIAKALRFIDQFHGVQIDWSQIPMDDPKTYELLRGGDAIGIFQLESEGMRKLVMRLQPTCFEDLAALLALYRPGPLQSGMVDQFINRKHGREAIEYPHDSLEPILKDTYGTCLTGDTIVTDAITGKPLRLDQVRGRDHLLVQGVDEELRPAIARVTHFFDQGVKEVFKLTLEDGRSIRATADHRFLTARGWVQLQELAPGDFVGTPIAEYRLEDFAFRVHEGTSRGDLRAFAELPFLDPENSAVRLAPRGATAELERLSRVRWMAIADIEPAGRENVYDITVESLHNFVANGMIVHNCIYQEQVMLIAQVYAGYSLGQADLLRRAMGKKKPEEMAKQKEIFLDGSARKGHPSEKAEALFDNLEKFAAYGFNKSHSAAYAVVTFRTAYLKAHYPIEYMCALLSSVIGTQDKVQLYIHNANQMGIKVLPPDVNASEQDFTVKDGAIRMGLSAIKNVGTTPVLGILQAREQAGGFTDLYQFCEEVDMKAVNKRCIESLIKAGAFDSTGAHRAQLLAALDEAVERAARMQKEKGSGQISLFSVLGADDQAAFTMPKPALPIVPALSQDEALQMEKELIGVYVSGHPLQVFGPKLTYYSTHELATAEELADNTMMVVGGLLTGTRVATTKKGLPMMSGRLEDLTGSLDVLFFPEAYEKYRHLLAEDVKILVKGKLSNRDDELKILASQVKPLEHLALLHVTLPETFDGGFLMGLRDNFIKKHPGEVPVLFHFPHLPEVVLAGEQFRVEPTDQLLFDLKKALGVGNVRLEEPAPAERAYAYTG